MRPYILCLLTLSLSAMPLITHAVPIKITCVGDSLTEGNGATDQNTTSYPAVLGSLLQANGEYQVGNFGYGGANLLPYAGTYTYTNTSKFVPGVNFAGDTIIIMLGTNDGASEGGSQNHLDEFTNSYDLLIQHYTAGRNPAPRIIVATPPWVPIAGGPWNQDTIHNKICPIVRSYAATRGYTLVDINLITWGHPEWSSDGMVHYNDAGYQAMAAAFYTAVTNNNLMPYPVAALSGNSNSISDGSGTLSTTNGTAFGSALVSNAVVDHVFRIQNNGSTNLILTGSPLVSINGANAADFTVVTQPTTTNIPTGSFTEFTLRFSPAAAGSRTATVSIPNNDTFRSPYDFAIGGTGTLPAPNAYTAYNDVAWVVGQPTSNITTYGIGTAGTLVDAASGTALGVQVALSGANAALWPGSGAGFTPSGTPAAEMLPTTRVDSVIHYYFTTATLTFSGLTPTNRYTFVLYSNRDGGYTNRYTSVEIQSALSFTNNSTTGTVSTSSATSTIFTGSSHGDIFRYDQVDPGGDGTVTFQLSGSSPCLNSFMVQTPSTNPASTNQPNTNVVSGWQAYNDTAYYTNEPAATGFSTISPIAGFQNSGSLVATNGSVLTAQVTFTTNLVTLLDRNFVGLPPGGSDAAAYFGSNKVGANHAANWTAGTVTMTLSSLNTGKQYSVVLWSTRGSDTDQYSNRVTDITLSSVDSFINSSSAGAEFYTSTTPGDGTRLRAAWTGKVARYDQIRPGPDGTIVFSLTAGASPVNAVNPNLTNGYLNAFMVQEMDLTTNTYVDANSNGMDDPWEITNFGSTNAVNGGMTQDWDHDGFDNYSEYRAGTSPTNAGSLLEFTALQPTNASALVLTWPGVNGRTYSIQQNTNLLSPWTTLQSGIPGVQPITVHTAGVSSVNRRYWRVKVE